MRLTIWQFVGLVLALIGCYLVYSLWWSKLDQNKIIHDTNTTLSGDTTPAQPNTGVPAAPASTPTGAKFATDDDSTRKTW